MNSLKFSYPRISRFISGKDSNAHKVIKGWDCKPSGAWMEVLIWVTESIWGTPKGVAVIMGSITNGTSDDRVGDEIGVCCRTEEVPITKTVAGRFPGNRLAVGSIFCVSLEIPRGTPIIDMRYALITRMRDRTNRSPILRNFKRGPGGKVI